MSDEITTVSVQILEREFRVACPPEERDGLIQSAQYLNKKMREIRDGGKVIGMDRIAVIAALNITHELLQSHHPAAGGQSAVNDKLRSLQQHLESALYDHRQMEL